MATVFVYGGIAYKGPSRAVVLCEYAAPYGSATCGAVFRVCLGGIPQGSESLKSYQYEQLTYHYRADNQGLVVCVATRPAASSFGRSSGHDERKPGTAAAFANIDYIRNKFLGSYPRDSWRRDRELELTDQWERVLQQCIENPVVTKLEEARTNLDEVTEDMRRNIQLVMDRGDAVDRMMEGADDLVVESTSFKKSSKKLKDELWWENKKYWLICACITVIVIAVLVLIIVLASNSRK